MHGWMGVHGSAWICMAVHGCAWLCMGLHGCTVMECCLVCDLQMFAQINERKFVNIVRGRAMIVFATIVECCLVADLHMFAKNYENLISELQ